MNVDVAHNDISKKIKKRARIIDISFLNKF
jgi:hypothetical protein